MADVVQALTDSANVRDVRGIAIRDELTNEWQKRGVKELREYAILTAEISRATFGMTPGEYKAFKSLAKPADNPLNRSGFWRR